MTRGLAQPVVVSVVALVMILSLPAMGVGIGMAVVDAAPPIDGDADISLSSNDPGAIDASLENATGQVEAIVVFEGPGYRTIASASQPTDTLQRHADTAFEIFEREGGTTAGITVEDENWLVPAALVTVDTEQTTLEEVARLDGVIALEANDRVSHTGATDIETATPAAIDEPSDFTYGLEQINVPTAWEEFDTLGEDTAVAVLDTGVDPDHPDIQVDKWQDFDPDNPSPDPIDYESHGTHVAGTVVGGDASGTHIGVAPEASLYAGAVLTQCDENGCYGERWQVVEGMMWAVEEDADVISMSLGGEGYSTDYLQAVEHAHGLGSIVVAASGNDGDGTAITPGNIYDAISVGASDRFADIAHFSSGKEIDTEQAWGDDAPDHWPDSYIVPHVAAPGVDIFSAEAYGEYAYSSGTSMATPHVAGLVALMQSATAHQLEPDDVTAAITETAWTPNERPPDEKDTRYGYGIVDAVAALDEVVEIGTIAGTVIDERSETFLDGVSLTAEAADGTTFTTETDEHGQYAFAEIDEEQTYTITAERDGYAPTSESGISVAPGEVTAVDLALRGDAAMSVTLLDAVFEEPVEDATLVASGPFGNYSVTDTTVGTYDIDGVPSVGGYELLITADGYQMPDLEDRTLTVDETDVTVERSISLTGDAELTLTVEDLVTGEAITDADVVLEREDGATHTVEDQLDRAGELSIQLAGTGEQYAITADAVGYTPTDLEVRLDSQATVRESVSLAGDATVEFTLEGATFGDRIDDASLALEGHGGTYPVTDAHGGVYTIEHVPSVGDFILTATASGYEAKETVVSVTESGQLAQTLSMTGDATIEISVEDQDGSPIAGATVEIERSDGAVLTELATTPASGVLEVAVPGLGYEYTVEAVTEKYTKATVETGPVDSEDTATVTVTMVSLDPIPGFGVAVAIVGGLAAVVVLSFHRRIAGGSYE